MRFRKDQGILFIGGDGGLERRLPRIVNNATDFGFEVGNLASFLAPDETKVVPTDHIHSASQRLFDGFNDLVKIGSTLPREIYQSLNTSEIAALFIGNVVAKKFPDTHFRKGKTYNELKNEADVAEIVSAFVGIGYQYAAIISMINCGFTGHPTRSGDLKRRIDSLSDNTKKMLSFVLLKDRAVPSRENPRNFDYFDPNFVGHRLGYDKRGSAFRYIELVASGMKEAYRNYNSQR